MTLFIKTKHKMNFGGLCPFIKLQNGTSTTIKRLKTMKNEMESKSTYLFLVEQAAFFQALDIAQPPKRQVLFTLSFQVLKS